MDARANDATALADRLQRQGHEVANGGKDDRGIERLRRHLVRSACPGRAEAPGKGLGGSISRPREGKHRAPLPLRDLRHDMCRGAKAIEPKLLALAGDPQRAPADQAGAEQRGERHVVAGLAERERKTGVGDHRRRETAVARVSGEERTVAEIFPVPMQ